MAFIDTRELLLALGDALLEVKWTPEGEEERRVLDSVAFYNTGKVDEAIKSLHSYDDEVAVIVPQGIAFENEENVGHLDSEKRLVIAVFFTGRKWGDKIEGFLGFKKQGSDWQLDRSTLGTLGMVDEVINGVSGHVLVEDAGPMEPVEGDTFTYGKEDKNGKVSDLRKGYYLIFECKAGEHEFSII